MKRYTLIIMALLFTCPFFSIAQKVKKEEATELAKIVFKKYNSGRLTNTKKIIALGSSTKTDMEEADTLLYIVPFEAGGYVIISGDKGAPPYLGYCPKGDFWESDLPPGLNYLLEKYKNKISRIRKDKISQNEDVKKRWENIYNQTQLKSVTSNVAPMLDTEWGQRYGFNDSIPNNYAAGCTAVAMAQILRYWECRVNPTGNLTWVWNGLVSHANFGATTYRWLDMDDYWPNTYSAQLIYHAGVSCQTKYKSTTSASSTPGRARDGFVDYWGMDNDADVKWRVSHLSNWKDMLVDELHNSRPILYSAGGAEIGDDWVYGHSWVIDGVTVDHNYFWCNWGWYGNHNGWYELGGFDPDGNNYNQMESAIFNVYPVQSSEVATPQLTNRSYTYNPNGYTLTIPEAFGASSYEWITDNGTISGNGSSVTLYTDKSATVQVRAYNNICNVHSSYDAATITINYGPLYVPDVICYNSYGTVGITNVPDVTVTWGGTNVSYPNGNTGVSVGVKATSSSVSAQGTVTASFTVDGTPFTLSEDVWVGKPNLNVMQFDITSADGGNWYVCTDQTGNSFDLSYFNNKNKCTNYEIKLTNPNETVVYDQFYSSSGIGDLDYPSLPEGWYVFWARGYNGCGWSNWVGTEVVFTDCSQMMLMMTPNPTSGETTLSIESNTDQISSYKDNFDYNAEWDMEVYSPGQTLKTKKTKLKGKSTTIQTAGWTEGIYSVRVKYKEQVLTGKLVVKR